MPKSPTLNRFPLFGLFAHQAARHLGYPEDDARLLGYSTALLYAIFKAKAQAKKQKGEKEPKKELRLSAIFGGVQLIHTRCCGLGMVHGGKEVRKRSRRIRHVRNVSVGRLDGGVEPTGV
jgi:hypothetical protein